MIYLHYKDTKTFGHSFSFLLIFKTLRASYLQVGNFSNIYGAHVVAAALAKALGDAVPALKSHVRANKK